MTYRKTIILIFIFCELTPSHDLLTRAKNNFVLGKQYLQSKIKNNYTATKDYIKSLFKKYPKSSKVALLGLIAAAGGTTYWWYHHKKNTLINKSHKEPEASCETHLNKKDLTKDVNRVDEINTEIITENESQKNDWKHICKTKEKFWDIFTLELFLRDSTLAESEFLSGDNKGEKGHAFYIKALIEDSEIFSSIEFLCKTNGKNSFLPLKSFFKEDAQKTLPNYFILNFELKEEKEKSGGEADNPFIKDYKRTPALTKKFFDAIFLPEFLSNFEKNENKNFMTLLNKFANLNTESFEKNPTDLNINKIEPLADENNIFSSMDLDEAKQNYKQLALIFHPDKIKERTTQDTLKVIFSNEIISDPTSIFQIITYHYESFKKRERVKMNDQAIKIKNYLKELGKN